MTDDRFIDWKELKKIVPLSRMHIWRLEKAGKFPLRVEMTERRRAWIYKEILAWMKGRPRS